MVLYTDLQQTTRQAVISYRRTLANRGRNHPFTAKARDDAFNWLDVFASQYVADKGPPVNSGILDKALNLRDGTVNQILDGGLGFWGYALLYHLLPWEDYRGEPLVEDARDGFTFLRSTRFGSSERPVVFSYDGVKSDISFIPRLQPPDSAAAELYGVLMVSGSPSIVSRTGKELGIVDRIDIYRREEDKVYLKKHVLPLFEWIFGVPKGFVVHYSYPNHNSKEQLTVQSPMVGSYFQNAVSGLEVKDGKVTKKKIAFGNNAQRRAFLRAVLDKSQITRNGVGISENSDVSEMVGECAAELGYPFSGPRPKLSGKYQMHPVSIGGETLYQMGVRVPAGRRVYRRSGKGVREIGVITGFRNGLAAADIKEEPYGEMYAESWHNTNLTGGVSGMKKLLGEVRPGNPSRLIRYASDYARKNFPMTEEMQNYVHETWDGDIDRLVAGLKRQHL